MGLVEWLYKLKNGEAPSQYASSPESCADHNYGPWEPVDRSESEWIDEDNECFDWTHKTEKVAVKYRRTRDGEVDKSNQKVVPYDDVKEKWCKLSGQQYFVIVACHEHKRECHCGKTESQFIPEQFVAMHCGDVVAEAESMEDLEDAMIEHDRNY